MSHRVERAYISGQHAWWEGTDAQGDAIAVYLGENPVSSKEAIQAAGLDWDVIRIRSGFLEEGEEGETAFRAVAPHCFLVRDLDRSVLGTCTDEYQPLQNREAFEFLDALVADGTLLYHTAGSLEKGQRVWILAQTPQSWTIQRRSGEVNHHHAFLNCMLGHNGNAGIALMATDIRVECHNTLTYADSQAEKENLVFRIPHRGDINAKLELAAKALEVMENESQERRRVLQAMAQDAMNHDEFLHFATSIFLGLDGPAEEIDELVIRFGEEATEGSQKIMRNRVAAVGRLFERGMGNEGDSAYDALNAWTEYYDHFDIGEIRSTIERNKKAAKAVTSSWIGIGSERKALAYRRLAERVRG